MRSYTRRFCIERELMVPSTIKKYCNIVWLNNGKAFVPNELWDEFIHAVSKDELEKSDPGKQFSYACEKPPEDENEGRRLVFDIDLESKNPVSDDYLRNIFIALGKTLRSCFPFDTFKKMYSIVLTSPIKKTKDGGYKNGLHISVIHAILTLEQCYKIRTLFISYLMEHFGGDRDGPLENGFEDAVDRAIYKGGLRLPGSCKASHCRDCSYRTRIDCNTCDGKGYIHEGRPYTISYMLNPHGNVLPRNDKVFHIFETMGIGKQFDCVTINAPHKEKCNDFKYPEDAPQPYIRQQVSSQRRKRGPKVVDSTLWNKNFDQKVKRRKNLVQIPRQREVFGDILGMIRSSNELYNNLVIQQIQKNESTGDYMINVTGRGCHHCFIKNKRENGENSEPTPHKSNRIWFLLSRRKNRLYQHCFDSDCKQNKHELAKPTPFQKRIFFPNTGKQYRNKAPEKSRHIREKKRTELLSLLTITKKKRT